MILREARLHTYKELNDIDVPTVTQLVLLELKTFQNELHIVIRLLQMDWLNQGNDEVFIPILKEHSIETELVRIYEKSAIWRVVSGGGGELARNICAVAHPILHIEERDEFLVSCPETGDVSICRDKVPLLKPEYQELLMLPL